jgi:formamidopyrimidine-DNA glycosylase
MTNKILVGVGNIYASEILFISRISPIRIASSLSRDEIKSVVENTKSVLEESIIKGGTTFRDYRSADNSKGGFQDELLVYGQNTCKVCESELQKITQGQRSTFFCENCQK